MGRGRELRGFMNMRLSIKAACRGKRGTSGLIPRRIAPIRRGLRQQNRQLARKIQLFGTSRCLDAKRKVIERRRAGLAVYDFGLGEAKGGINGEFAEAGKQSLAAGRTEYVDPQGLLELRRQIISWLGVERNYGPQNVCVSVGAKQAIFNILLAICDPGDTVLYDAAPWVSYIPMTYCAGLIPQCVSPKYPEANYLKISSSDLERAINRHRNARIFLLNSPCNPSGQIYSAGELNELIEVCIRNRIFFALDRLYWKTVFDGYSFPEPVINEVSEPWIIQIDGLSKNWRSLGGLRVGWSVGSEDLTRAATNIQSHITSGTATVGQYVALEALTKEYDWEMRDDLQEKRDLMFSVANDIPGLKAFPTAAAFYSFWDVRAYFGSHAPNGKLIAGSDDLAEYLLNSAGVVVLPGTAFKQEGYLRLCFHTAKSEIQEGMLAVRAAIEDLC